MIGTTRDPAKVRGAYQAAQAELEVCRQVIGALEEIVDEKRREEIAIESRVRAIGALLEPQGG